MDSRDTSDLQKVLNYCCFGINADILMMLTYITEDARMLDSLLDMALNCVSGWDEVSLDQKSIPLLSPNEESPVFQIPEGDVKKKQAAHEVSQEKKKTHLSKQTALKLYDYNENDVDLLGNQLARAMSLMVVVARCLPSFEHMMRVNTKRRFVAAIYELPHRIFYRWATEMNIIVDDLVEQLYALYSEANQNNPRIKVPSKDVLSSRIRSDALCQYLNILYAAVVYSTRANTIEYLNEYDYRSGSTYGIMHAMMLERRERIDDLFKEMAELYDKNENPVVCYLVQRVMHHSVIFSKKMTKPQTQRIEEKFLDGGKGHQQRLVVRNKKR